MYPHFVQMKVFVGLLYWPSPYWIQTCRCGHFN